jgi:hypothetical protein
VSQFDQLQPVSLAAQLPGSGRSGSTPSIARAADAVVVRASC